MREFVAAGRTVLPKFGRREDRSRVSLRNGRQEVMKVESQNWPVRGALAVGLLGLLGSACGAADAAVRIEGQVQAGGGPVANSTVTLWAGSAGDPRQLAQAKTADDGSFALSADETPGPGVSLYLIAKGGVAAVNKGGGDNPALAFLTVLGGAPPAKIVVNEMTTIASVWTNAQFLDGVAIKGPALSLSIAAGNVHNFVDLATGGYGATIADGLNSTQTPTLANFATLADVLAGCAARVKADACDSLFAAVTSPEGKAPAETLAAAESIARAPWHNPEKIFALLESFYPVPDPRTALRAAPFMPYLSLCSERLGPAAEVLRRRPERRRQADVRQPGQYLGRRQFHGRRPEPGLLLEGRPLQVRPRRHTALTGRHGLHRRRPSGPGVRAGHRCSRQSLDGELRRQLDHLALRQERQAAFAARGL